MCKQFETCERRLIGKGSVWMACTLAALGLTICSPARGQAGAAATTRRAPLQTMRAPAATQGTAARRGTVQGVVFWDSRRVAYSPSSSCQGLQVNLTAVSGTSAQAIGSTSQLQLKPPSQPASSVYQCGFSFSGVPEGVTLQVQLTISAPFASQVGSVGPFKGTTAFEIPGGTCSNPSPAPDFESGWRSCGENLTNVNFQLVPRSMAQATPAPSAVLQQTPRTLLPAQPQGSAGTAAPNHGLLLPAVNGGPVMSTPAAQRTPGGTSTIGNSNAPSGSSGANTRMLNPQPYPPKSAPNASGSANHASANVHAIGNSNAPEATSALIGLLRKQGSLRVVSGQPAKYASSTNVALVNTLRRQKQAGQIGAGHAMASRTSSISSMVEAPNPALHATRVYVVSDLLTDQENQWCQRQEADHKAPTILRVDGQTHGIQYSPDPQANPYTIVGCGFGNSNGTVHLKLMQYQYGVSVYTVQFTIQSWSDHEIVASVDPTTSGVPDWSQVILEVKANLAAGWGGGQFTALRQTVALASISQTQVSLDQAGSPHFLSPVSNYYGLNGSVGVARQGLAGPVAGQDQFKLKLAPGFVVDSTETDLLVSNTSSNVTSQPATLNGNTITVTYPVVSAPSGNSVVYYSIYGLKVYVTGPVGMNPLAQ